MKTGHLDGQGLAELRNYNIQNLSSAPTTSLYKGRIYFNTTDNKLYVYDGTNWVDATSQGNYTFTNGLQESSRTVSVKTDNSGNVTLSTSSSGLKGVVGAASTSAAGVIEIATDSEATTGTSETLAVNPKQLKTKIGLTDISIDSGSSNYLGYDNTTGKISAKVDTTVTDSSSKLITSGAVSTAIANAIVGGVIYKGTWNITSATDYSGITLPVKKGYMYYVTGTGPKTIGGIEWNAGDYLLVNDDVAAGGSLTGKVEKIDNTEAADIVRTAAAQTLTNKTIDADDNTISDLTTSNFKSGTITTSVSSSSTNGEIPTALAVNTAIGEALLNKNYSASNPALTTSSGLCTWTVTHNLNKSNVTVDVYETIGSGTNKVLFDYSIDSANQVTVKILSDTNISAATYKVIIIS